MWHARINLQPESGYPLYSLYSCPDKGIVKRGGTVLLCPRATKSNAINKLFRQTNNNQIIGCEQRSGLWLWSWYTSCSKSYFKFNNRNVPIPLWLFIYLLRIVTDIINIEWRWHWYRVVIYPFFWVVGNDCFAIHIRICISTKSCEY